MFQELLFPEGSPPKCKVDNKPNVESRCTACGSVVGKGRTHKCNKVTSRENTLGLVNKMSLKSKERTTRDALMALFEEQGVPKSPKSGIKTHWQQVVGESISPMVDQEPKEEKGRGNGPRIV